MVFSNPFNLSSLDGINGFVINGIDVGDQSGISVSSAGDINGDGIDDLIIGALAAAPNGISGAGESYVVFGKNTPFSASLSLSSLNGANGFVINGIDPSDLSGRSVSSAGDVNGDGIDDLIIGANVADPNGNTNAGESYVVFGKNTGFSSSLNLSSLDGTEGFVINGIDPGDFSGTSVSSAGDINGDGIGDIIIGATNGDPNGNTIAGESYVVFGKNTGFSSSLNLSSLNGTDGFVLNGIDQFDQSGFSVSSAGDINGDGIDDLIIGATGADPNGNSAAGESYVVFGKNTGFSSSLELSSLDGINGFVINGIDQFDQSGISVSSAGDVNSDGIDDLIIGATGADPNGNSGAGESYVVFGRNTGFNASFNLSSLDGSNGFIINGIDSIDNSGFSVSSAGDVNGDGIDDLIIGATGGDPNGNSTAGESYVVFGVAPNTAPEITTVDTVSIPENTTNVIDIDATDDNDSEGSGLTYALSSGDDAALFTVNTNTGQLDFITAPDFETPTDADGDNDYLVQVTVTDSAGLSDIQDLTVTVTDENDIPGIINGTENDDLINGTVLEDTINGLGGNDTINGLNRNDLLNGNDGNDVINGGGGQDILNGDAGDDTLVGGGNNDTLNGGDDSDRLVGITGNDLLNGDGGNDTLFGRAGDHILNGGEGNDFLTSSDGNDLLNAGEDNDTLISRGGNDTLNGDAGSDRLISRAGADILNGGEDNDTLISRGGDDTLNGDAGSDRLISIVGADILNGGEGNDTLLGNDGNDTLRGDGGNDTLAGGQGSDFIRDFELGTDSIGLADGLSFGDLSFVGREIMFGSEILSTINFNTNQLSESDFVSI